MGALAKTIGMLIVCLVLLACCWSAMLSTLLRWAWRAAGEWYGPAGWLFWLVPLAIWGGGSLVLSGLLREGLDGDERWALGLFWLPLLAGAILLWTWLPLLTGAIRLSTFKEALGGYER